MNLIRKLDALTKRVELNRKNKPTKKQSNYNLRIVNSLNAILRNTCDLFKYLKILKKREIDDLKTIITSKLLIIKKHCEFLHIKKMNILEKKIRKSTEETLVRSINYLKRRKRLESKPKTSQIEESLSKIKDNLFFNISKSLKKKSIIDSYRRRIEIDLNNIIKRILERSLEINKRVSEEDVIDEYDIKENIKDEVLIEANKKDDIKIDLNQVEYLNFKISKAFLHIKSHILLLDENFKNTVTESFIFVLNKGSLETDKRFVELIEKTLKDIEKFKDPVVIRMGIQFILAKKYVTDIIFLKERALSKKYLICK
ncbi:hypothetical protein NGRA_0311 [Nosema granulosis]|uniref:Uncharacterized protein n=1 Tax=Nosema granulosis TaxID=83296 RepID=A0A9P6H160_9MICR|nr:hypothetical protein NGRA_0311 [Nosema granulosis]